GGGHGRGAPRRVRASSTLKEPTPVAELHFPPPAGSRRRIEKTSRASRRVSNRRSVLKGFVMGTALSTAMAASLVIAVFRTDQEQRLLGEVTSAHVRSLQANHLTDVQTSDQHTVKPWFNGKVDIAPPVVDLTAKGFTMLGGRLDYIDGQAVASIVYRRRTHVINLFVTQGGSSESHEARLQTMQGYNIRRWTAQGLQFFAVSDINGEE